jgi:hypothetical protein
MMALGTLLLAAALLLLYATRHLTFFFDEWDIILDRRGTGISTYLDPHNGHLLLFPVAVYKVLFAIVGLRHYTPYVFVLVVLHLLCAALLYVLARRRVGPLLALAPAVLLLFMGTAYQDLLWAFQISLLGSVAGGLAALALLEHKTRRADALAALMLAWSLSSSGVGAAFLVACAVVVIAQRSPWRRLWVVIAPAALFAIWYIGWGTSQHITSDSVLAAPQYIADAAAGAVAGMAGLSSSWGPALAVATFAAIALLWSRRLDAAPSPMLLAALAGALSFWGLSAVERADVAEPTASRYLYIGAVFILLMAVDVAARIRPRVGPLVLGGLLLAGALISNLNALRAGERGLRASDTSVRASLRVIEVAAPVVAPTFVPEPVNAPQVSAGPYLAAVRDLGSPALSERELEIAPEGLRVRSDGVLEQAEQLSLIPARGSGLGLRPVTVTASAGGLRSSIGPCTRFDPTGPTASIDLQVRPGAVLLLRTAPGTPGALYLRRYASTFAAAPFAQIAPGRNNALRLPADLAPALPWHVRIATAHRLDACLS